MASLLASPPVAFAILLLAMLLCAAFFSRYATPSTGEPHEADAYACGQKGINNYVSPDYTQFFPFAVLFTIMHVLVLMVATAPRGQTLLPVTFIGLGLFVIVILYKR